MELMESKHEQTMETAAGAMGVLTAGGAITFGLFPFLLPGVVLLAALALPLGIVAALFAGLFLLARSVMRIARRDLRPVSRDRRGDPVLRHARRVHVDRVVQH
jgi:hypothetical protein